MKNDSSHPTPEIDFLPESYRREAAKQKQKYWRLALVCFLTALFPLASAHQFQVLYGLKYQIATVRTQYSKAHADKLQLRKLQDELRQARDEAELATLLRHPWPTSQLLAAVVAEKPESISFREISIERTQAKESVGFGGERRRAEANQPGQSVLSTAAQDVASLRAQLAAGRLTTVLSGETTDIGELHTYLGSLSAHRLFEHAELESIESAGAGAQPSSRFRLRIQVRPGYGLPGGPTEPPLSLTPEKTAHDSSITESVGT